jgi:ribonuclease H / adenosylcobalamin/alpha-ribazole phosphatase
VRARLAVIVEADGGSRGNPGPAGYGAVLKESRTGEVLAERSGSLGVATNNVAEYAGLIAGLTAAAELGAVEVEVRMDSKLVVEQMAGRWQIKNAGLRPLAAEAAALVQRFASVRFSWIPREQNRDADALANAAMDAAAAPAPPAVSWEPPVGGSPLRLLLVRHGETELTAGRRYSGRGDVALSALGEEQAMAVARRIAGLVASAGDSLGAVVTSPLSRCVSTANAIAETAGGVPVVVDDDLIECDFGVWEGLTFAEVREQFPNEMARWLGTTSVAPPGGESFEAVGRRVERAVSRLRDTYDGKQVALVSHVTPLKLILRDALVAGDQFLFRCYLDPAGLSIVDTWSDGGVAVRTINDTAHLTA